MRSGEFAPCVDLVNSDNICFVSQILHFSLDFVFLTYDQIVLF